MVATRKMTMAMTAKGVFVTPTKALTQKQQIEILKVELLEANAKLSTIDKKHKEKIEAHVDQYKDLKYEFESSNKFREEARKRCVRYEKLMFLMIDKLQVSDIEYEELK